MSEPSSTAAQKKHGNHMPMLRLPTYQMGAPADGTKGLWSMFLANITVPEVHSQAFHAYMTEKAAYGVPPVQARITKPTPVILTYVKSVSVTHGSQHRGQPKEGAQP